MGIPVSLEHVTCIPAMILAHALITKDSSDVDTFVGWWILIYYMIRFW